MRGTIIIQEYDLNDDTLYIELPPPKHYYIVDTFGFFFHLINYI